MNASWLVRVAGPVGLYALARKVTSHHPRILMYHRFSIEPGGGFISATTFERQILQMVRHHKPITLLSLADHVRKGTQPPRHSIVITIDDGYRDFYDVAWPILRRHGVPATVFVTTGFIDQELWLWPDQVAWLLRRGDPSLREVEVAGQRFSNIPDSWQPIVDRLLSIPETHKQAAIIALARQFRVDVPFAPPQEYFPMTWDQIREMQAAGLEVGGHTHSHPSLARVAPHALEHEIHHCLERLNTELGLRERTFCYPNGLKSDYNKLVRDTVQIAGFVAAVVAYADENAHTDLFTLRRHSSSESDFQFLKASSGVEWLGRKMNPKRIP